MTDLKKQNQNSKMANVFPEIPKSPEKVAEKEPSNVISQKEQNKSEKTNQVPAKKSQDKDIKINETSRPAKKSAKQIFIGFLAFVLGLIGLAYAFILWSLMEGGLSNPLFEILGMRPEELKLMLLTVTNSIFGFISLIFMIATLVKLFQWMMTSSDSEYKRKHLRKMGGYFGILAFFVTIWIGLYWLISRAEANPINKSSTESMIITTPKNVTGLTAPVSVTFDIGKNLYKKIPAKFVRQIEWDLNNDDVLEMLQEL